MSSISVDAANMCIRLVCVASEVDVTFAASDIYKAWKDWWLLSDNSKYLPAMDSAGGNPVGTSSLDNVYFILTANGWMICPQTVESSVILRIDGNLFPDVVGEPIFGYAYVAGNCHIETLVSTSARLIETGVSELLADIAAVKAKTDSLTFTAPGIVDANTVKMNDQDVIGSGTEGDSWRGLGVSP